MIDSIVKHLASSGKWVLVNESEEVITYFDSLPPCNLEYFDISRDSLKVQNPDPNPK